MWSTAASHLRLHLSVRSEVAILYNDRSVLENHHVSAAYRLMAEEDMNILVNLNKDDWRCTHTDHTHRWFDTCTPREITFCPDMVIDFKSFILVCIAYWQGAQGSGHRDGYVHRHVMPLSADQDHEECPDTDTQVRMQSWLLTSSSIHVQLMF